MKMIPLFIKEGPGMVDWRSDADTHHPLPPTPSSAEKGSLFHGRPAPQVKYSTVGGAISLLGGEDDAEKTLWWLVAAAGTVLASISVIFAQAGGQAPIYLDAKRPLEERVDDLMSRMTLKEKVGQLNLPCVYVSELGAGNVCATRGMSSRRWHRHFCLCPRLMPPLQGTQARVPVPPPTGLLL
jgi:hypothetical protein